MSRSNDGYRPTPLPETTTMGTSRPRSTRLSTPQATPAGFGVQPGRADDGKWRKAAFQVTERSSPAMPYEIDFHPVGSGANSGDAITMRYWTGTDWRVIVTDSGLKETGDAIVEHVLSVYGTAEVEHLVSTHHGG